MSTPDNQLPAYIATASPNPASNRAAWNKNTAPTYAGIFLWFVFWMGSTNAPFAGGVLSHGVWAAVLSLAFAALLCHAFYYVVLGIIGQKTGFPLYIVGTSTFGAKGGFILPGFLMGVLQFGWLGVNIYFSALAITGVDPGSLADKAVPFKSVMMMIIYGALAAFMGLKGIQYVARVATYLPLIPLATLIIMFIMTMRGLGSFDPAAFTELHASKVSDALPALSPFMLFAFVVTFVVGFFATAGAAGVDFGTNSRNERDVHMGGVVGITAAIIFTAGLAMLIVAGAYGRAEIAAKATEGGVMRMDAFALIPVVLGEKMGKLLHFLLAIAAFPAACFSAFIAANSFKTTLSKVNPFVSVGIGTAIAILLSITKLAGDLVPVFTIIGASFGPICGAMAVDYIINGCKWAGPRAGFNPAGWLAWGFGFFIGIMPNLGLPLPLAPVWAMLVGAVIYYLASKAGLQSATLAMPTKK